VGLADGGWFDLADSMVELLRDLDGLEQSQAGLAQKMLRCPVSPVSTNGTDLRL